MPINDTSDGIYLSHSSYNNLTGNVADNNDNIGINLDYSQDNVLWLNTFANNDVNAVSNGDGPFTAINVWNSTSPLTYTDYNGITHVNYTGNYWGDYSGPDANSDGIGDSYYPIADFPDFNYDQYPMMLEAPPAHINPIIVDQRGPDYGNFTDIGSALDYALPGDTIIVDSGTYNEHLLISKPVNITGMDTGTGAPVVYADDEYSVFVLEADGVTVQGLAINGSDRGLRVYSSNNTIINNSIYDNGIGIFVDMDEDTGHIADNNTVSNNTFINNEYGIYTESSNYNNITKNTFLNADETGVFFDGSNNNNLANNTFDSNSDGIDIEDSSDNNNVTGNMVNDSDEDGVYLYNSIGNVFWLNTFSNNDENAETYADEPEMDTNIWNSLTPLTYIDYNGISHENYTGNYWDDYAGQDANSDGIGDSPYVIDDYNLDNYPMLLSGPAAHINPIVVDPVPGVGMFTDINDAIDYALPGDTILVHSGVYSAITVNKPINITGVDTGDGMPEIRSTFSVSIVVDNVTFSGFNVSGVSVEGITVGGHNDTISNNLVSGHYDDGENTGAGIFLASSGGNNTLTGNVLRNNSEGIVLWFSYNNTIWLNTFKLNGENARAVNDGLPDHTNYWNSTMPLAYTDYNGIQHVNYTGNYWGDYNGKDANSDGIGDTPYSNGYVIDNYPLFLSASQVQSNSIVVDPVPGVGMFTNITPAIAYASDGETIIVDSGTYVENINVNKPVTLQGQDTGSGMPVIDGNGLTPVVLSANGLTFSGFNVTNGTIGGTNGDDGISVYCNNSTIADNLVSGSTIDIELTNANNNSITNNTIWNCDDGILVENSNGNVFWLNRFHGCSASAWNSYSNLWDSTTKLYYEYGGSSYLNYTGNYWDVFGGHDSNGDGIADESFTPDSGTYGFTDYYPMLYSPHVNPIIVDQAPGSGDFTTISDAMKYAWPGDTIVVHSGIYSGITIDKLLTLTGVDTGDGLPVIQLSGDTYDVDITADNVTFTGFNVTGYCYRGISISSNNNTISNDLVTGITYGEGVGIYLESTSSNNTVRGNNVSYNNGGMNLDSSNNSITDNIVQHNRVGINVNGNNNSLTGCNVSYNDNDGVFTQGSFNDLTDNVAIFNGNGFEIDSSADNISMIDNNASNNGNIGILIHGSGNNLTGNTMNDNAWSGIYLDEASNNNISSNSATGNGEGICFYSASGNLLWLNVFINNTENAHSSGEYNVWNSAGPLTYTDYNGLSHENYVGNYWGDYIGQDANSDGIGDTPYVIDDNNVDNYPMLLSSPAPHVNPIIVDPVPGVGLFTDIRDALDYALPGDTIIVDSGTYIENVIINKSIVVDGMDTGSGLPIVDGSGLESINITANGVTLSGFNVTNATDESECGIQVSSINNIITGNIVSNNYYGIELYYSTDNIVTGNTVNNNSEGIYITDSDNNTVTNNTANENTGDGIHLHRATYNNVTDNTANENHDGIDVEDQSDYNNVTGNTAGENTNYGIYLDYFADNNNVTGNIANENYYGIYFYRSNNNNLDGNTFNENNWGIQLDYWADNNSATGNTANDNIVDGFFLDRSNNNTISNNVFDTNGNGIHLNSSNNNVLTGNLLENSTNYNIYMYDSAGNVLWLNTFPGNDDLVGVEGDGQSTVINLWNSTTPLTYTDYNGVSHENYVGNYWGDYTGQDSNVDGIGDTPYVVDDNNIDQYPMLLSAPLTHVNPIVVDPVPGVGMFTSINPAIAYALPGDTILVDSGNYAENVVVDKPVILMDKDTGNGLPVIDGNGGTGIAITANGTTVQGFNTTNSQFGIEISSSNNTVSGNVANNNYDYGIFLDSGSNNNTVSGNTADNNEAVDIYVYYGSSNNTVTGNTANNSSNEGIYLWGSNNTVTGNTVNNNYYGFLVISNNIVSGNTANDNTEGIELDGSNNTMVGNIVSNNLYGFDIYGSNNALWLNVISGNTIENAFASNGYPNQWNSTTPLTYTDYNGVSHTNYTGNYWGDYAGQDSNSDGIGDAPYVIDQYNVDLYPMLLEAPAVNVPLVAGFIASPTTGAATLSVQFNDTSTGDPAADSWNYTISNSTTTVYVNSQNFTYQFEYPDTYLISLNASNSSNGAYAISDTQPIYVYSGMLASFTMDKSNGVAPLSVQFNDTTTGYPAPDSWNWSITNSTGTFYNTSQNFSYTFLYPDTYAVSLNASNSSIGGFSIANTQFISVTTGLTAGFSVNKSSGASPLTVQFNDTSSGINLPDTWDWEVYNSSEMEVYSGTAQNFTYTFLIPDSYTVTLQVSNTSSEETSTSDSQTIAVSSIFGASFVVNQTSGPAPLTVQFNDTSLGNNAPDTWLWELYDSEDTLIYTNTSQNFSYTFLAPGTYNVNFQVSNSTTTESATATSQSITVTSDLVASFSADQSSGTVPLSVMFNDTSSGAPTSWDWSINNSTGPVYSATSQNFSYVFWYPDTYTVNLTASDGTQESSATTLIDVSSSLTAGIAANRTNGQAPLEVQFNDTTTGYPTPESWSWDIVNSSGEVYSTLNQNFSYVFQYPDAYTITLQVANGSWASSTNVVVTVNSPNAPVADFTAIPSSGTVPLTVAFTDISSGSPTSWDWSIDNSSGPVYSNTSQNFSYQFLYPDTYTVTLFVQDAYQHSSMVSHQVNVLPPMLADFTSNVTGGLAPLDVQFNDTTIGYPATWQWTIYDAGNNLIYSDTHQNISYHFNDPGTYNVMLQASNGTRTDSLSKLFTVDTPAALAASFIADHTSGMAPLTVQFNDTSAGYPASWSWTITNSTGPVYSLASQNLTFTFLYPDTYTVMLQVVNGTQSDSTSSQISVSALVPLVAGFNANTTAGVAPLAVQLNDTSTGYPASWQWTITDSNDVIVDSDTNQNITYTFNAPDTYTVTLQVTNGTRTDTTSSQIIVTSPAQLFADFTAIPNSGVAPLAVQLNDTSTGYPQSWEWNLGDSPANQTTRNVSYTYNDPGTYTVMLTVVNGTVSSTASHQIIVSAPIVPAAGFTANLTKGVEPLAVQFTDTSTGVPTNWSWDFGDGNTSYAESPMHVYSTHGLYTVKLNATNQNGSNVMTKADYINVTVSLLHGGVYTAPLGAGWNMVSFPLDNDPLNASDLNGTGVSEVAVFNTTTGRYDVYMEGKSSPDQDIPIKPGVGYFIYCDSPTNLDVKGVQPTLNSVSLHIGWNLIGWNSQTPSNAKAICAELAGTQEVVRYDTDTGYFQGYAEDATPDSYNFAVQPGEAYFIYTDTAESLGFGGA